MKKLISLLICLLMLSTWIIMGYAEETDDVIHISSLEDFLVFAENCRLDQYSEGKSFLLTTDIDLSGSDFDGIPIFLGTFDGAYHTIKGFDLQSSGSMKGLFRKIESTGVVKNLNADGQVSPTGLRSVAGGIVGSNAGTIENCLFSGTIAASEYAGGIAGINHPSGRIIGCSVSGIVSASHFSGGIAGSNEGTIKDCTNEAGINLTAQQNQIEIGDITLGNITNTESLAATTDIGGIAGYSKGTIISCINRGNVGYPHMGYNVGGIVGLQVGYISDCENYGLVSGRKEVGGIVGQQEPEVLLRYDTDTLQILKSQFDVLSDLIDRASANSDTNTGKIRNLIYKLEKYVETVDKSLDYLKSGLEDPQWEDLQSYVDAVNTIRESMKGIEDTLGKLWDALDNTTEDLESDIDAIVQQMAVIESILNNADDHIGGQFFDSSDADTVDDLTSKIENCRNYASVLGDLNAGGIVGAIVFENDLDPEEDISVVGDITLNMVGTIRSVILDCTNNGAVNAKNQHIGGIVGWQSMGLVKGCTNTGSLENPSADYVGGIAGLSGGYIRNCKVKSKISGDSYVGGIAGSGTILSNNYAMVEVFGTELTGCILGIWEDPNAEVDEPILNNYYLHFGKDFGAIDGISYYGKAQGLSQQDFFAAQSECPVFSQVTICFLVDGEIVYSFAQPSGTSFESIPDVPQKDGFVGQWVGLLDTDFSCVLFDLHIYAQYVEYTQTVQSDKTDEAGRPILLLQGDFLGSHEVAVTQLLNYNGLQNGEILLQAWQFSATNSIHLEAGRLINSIDADLEKVKLMVRDQDGIWKEHAYTIDGSYLVFYLADGENALALVQRAPQSLFTAEVLIAALIGALTVLVIVMICIVVKRKKRK